ncbi:MAG: hypothetical protein ACO3KD_08950 [Gaiellales bacterium]
MAALHELAGAGREARTTATSARRERSRTPALVAAGLAALGIAVAVAVAVGLQWAHFVGATPDGRIAVYQGLPVDITADLALYRPVVTSGIPAAALDAAEALNSL